MIPLVNSEHTNLCVRYLCYTFDLPYVILQGIFRRVS